MKRGNELQKQNDRESQMQRCGGSRKQNSRGAVILFVVLLLLFVGTVWLSAHLATLYDTTSVALPQHNSAWRTFLDGVSEHASSSLGLLLLQITVILLVARLVGGLFVRMGQPRVIGEIIAGILLGPGVLGALAPGLFARLFPASSISVIEILSQFGLILFMFTIGMELRPSEMKANARKALVISQAGIFIPFISGMLLTIPLYTRFSYTVPYLPLSLFMGIAMSITAFPVLARIIQERSMSRTHLGSLTLSTAAVADITAWLMLAGIMAITQSGSVTGALFNFLFLLLYAALFFGVLKPLFALVGSVYNKNELVNKTLIAGIFILLVFSAYLTDILSMHALFGAFMVGLIMPDDNKFRHLITEKVEDVSLNIFLPLFFVSSGLRTELGLINSPELWGVLLLLVVVAIVGKVGGTYIAARTCGMDIKESLYLGAFMNTRGLMELVVLKIGLDLGVLPPTLFVLLVMMTLITTVMTHPLVQLFDALFKWRARHSPQVTGAETKPILISFGRPDTGSLLLRLAEQIIQPELLKHGATVLHTTADSSLSLTDEETYFEENFNPILKEGKHLGISVEPLHRVTDDVVHAIVEEANEAGRQYLFAGAGLELSEEEEDRKVMRRHGRLAHQWRHFSIASPTTLLRAGQLFNDKTRRFFKETDCNVGIFVNRNFGKPSRIAIVIGAKESFSLLPYAQRMASFNKGRVVVLRLAALWENEQATLPAVYATEENEVPVQVVETIPMGVDFLMVSYATWQSISAECPEVLEQLPSTLIMELKDSRDELRVPADRNLFE